MVVVAGLMCVAVFLGEVLVPVLLESPLVFSARSLRMASAPASPSGRR